MTCPLVDIAKELKTDIETSRDNGDFSDSDFTVRVGLGDFPEKLEDDEHDSALLTPFPLVEVVLPVIPELALIGRPIYEHRCQYRVGVRRRLGAAYFRTDGQVDIDKIEPLFDLYYELAEWFFPDRSNRHGSITKTDDWEAIWEPPFEIVMLWDKDKIQYEYCGIFGVNCKIQEKAQ